MFSILDLAFAVPLPVALAGISIWAGRWIDRLGEHTGDVELATELKEVSVAPAPVFEAAPQPAEALGALAVDLG